MTSTLDSSASNHPTKWQERVREDADWIHNRIWNERNHAKSRQEEENSYGREFRAGLSGGAIGTAIGAGLAALESLKNKEPVQFSRLASYAGSVGLVLAIVNSWMTLGERDISTRKQNDLKHLNRIRNLLADAYGENALKGQYQWYDWYQEIKNDPILRDGTHSAEKSR